MGLAGEEKEQKIRKIKKSYGKRLFIPAHHYERDEIVRLADCVGDSLELSRAAERTDASYIVFCGVKFMAETARVLAGYDKIVLMPREDAGCPLADFGSPEAIKRVYERLDRLHPGEYIPITYVNSHVAVKAFCGDLGGLVCTSSNAKKIVQTVLEGNKRVLFMPDRNLGINTAREVGMEEEYEIVGGTDPEGEVSGKRIAVWDGYCYVHRAFTVEQVKAVREMHPGVTVIVHPECDPEVAKAADLAGSTSQIKSAVEEAPSGSSWAVGTELTFVRRLQDENRDKLVKPLADSVCEDMSKSRIDDLLRTLELVESGDYAEQVLVAPEIVEGAKKAIVRMLEMV
jgi:quinolinate synthase